MSEVMLIWINMWAVPYLVPLQVMFTQNSKTTKQIKKIIVKKWKKYKNNHSNEHISVGAQRNWGINLRRFPFSSVPYSHHLVFLNFSVFVRMFK